MRIFILNLLSFSLLFICYQTAHADTSTLANKNIIELQKALVIYQNAALTTWPILPSSITLKIGNNNPVIILLREQLLETHDLLPADNTGNTVFDPALEKSIKAFQARNGLKDDGIVGHDTRVELNTLPAIRVKQILVNIQRWENLSTHTADLSDRYVMVNIPDYHLYLIENNKMVLSIKAIVGKFTRQTPELSSKITHIILNPYWNVPSMIAKKDIVPKIIDDPDYLNNMHIKVFKEQEDHATQINSDTIDWDAVEEDDDINYHFRQDPGSNNALGAIKFEFANIQNVYLHDTPTKELFNEDKRMFSSGCIRLQNPFALADYLMKDDPEWNADYVQHVLTSHKNTYIKVHHPIPIYITYFTAWVDENGILQFRDDIYDRDTEISHDNS